MVNVNDFKNELPEGDLLMAIFRRQRELIQKYHEIEQRNTNYRFPMGLDGLTINDRTSQLRFKDFAWRITEELTEATECIEDTETDHFVEELIDALHFYVELMIYSKVGPLDVTPQIPEGGPGLLHFLFDVADQVNGVPVRVIVYDCIEELGKAMNCLKNKPWKQTPMVTDEGMYRCKLVNSFVKCFRILKAVGLTPEETVLIYLNKSDVNRFRIRSAY